MPETHRARRDPVPSNHLMCLTSLSLLPLSAQAGADAAEDAYDVFAGERLLQLLKSRHVSLCSSV